MTQYYVENDHEAIIPKEIFREVQTEIKRRAELCRSKTGKKSECSRYSGYALTGVLLCGECGQGYRRVTWSRNGKKKIVWRCSNRLKKGKRNCQKSASIEEKVLHSAIMKAIDWEIEDAEELIRSGRDNILYLTGNCSRENAEKMKEDNDDWKKGFENYYVIKYIENLYGKYKHSILACFMVRIKCPAGVRAFYCYRKIFSVVARLIILHQTMIVNMA